MLAQTKDAIEALKKAGLPRSKFSVRATRNQIPAGHGGGYEYGRVKINVWMTAEAMEEYIPNIITNGIGVTEYQTACGAKKVYQLTTKHAAHRVIVAKA